MKARTLALFSFLVLFPILSAKAKDDWQPISKEELQMTDYAASPGVAAVILYRENNEDDTQGFEEHYFRVKILTEAGKRHANIETPPYYGPFSIGSIKARTIQPDGSIVPFEGKVFDKVVVKSRGVKMSAKTWTMPDVRVGSIIEYRYTLRWDREWVVRTRWLIQHELPTQRAHFTFKPNPALYCSWVALAAAGQAAPRKENNGFVLDVQNVAGFAKEAYMPPEDEVRARIEFFYSLGPMLTGDEYWQKEGKAWRNAAEGFMDKKGAAAREVAGLVAASDSPEQKLQKLYAAVQKLRNLTYERARADDAAVKDNQSIEDVLKRGYGYHNQLNRTFVALARAAGIEATLVNVAERDEIIFHKEFPLWSQLSSELALVTVNAKEMYLDPGTRFCPFGILPWEDTGVAGMRAVASGAHFVTTPLPDSSFSVRKRDAKFTLDNTGILSGTLRLTFEGQEALAHRLRARDDDDKQRAKQLQDEVRAWLPANATVELKSVNGWESSDLELIAEFNLELRGMGAITGRRVLLPTAFFREANPFSHDDRRYTVYFRHAYREQDEVELALPPGLEVETLPASRNEDRGAVKYVTAFARQANTLRMSRQVVMDGVVFPTKCYPALKNFYSLVKSGDDERAILRAVAQ